MAVRIVKRDNGVTIAVKVVPGASRDRIIGELGDALKISVRQPPADGAANSAVLALLAEVLEIPAKRLQIIKGHTSPRKEIQITGLSAEAVLERLELA